MRSLTTFLLVWVCLSLFAQVNYTANNQIKPYTGDFRAAMNLGYYPPFNEEQLAILSAGSKDLGVEGIGIKALRPLIPDNFTEVWGLNFRINTLKQYQTLGIADNTTIVGFPADWHELCNSISNDDHNIAAKQGRDLRNTTFSNPSIIDTIKIEHFSAAMLANLIGDGLCQHSSMKRWITRASR